MKIVVYASNLNMGSIDSKMGCVVRGFQRHGIAVQVNKPGQLDKCDLAVCWGVRRPHQMRTGRRSLIVERAYVGDRFYWTSLGYDGLNGRADFVNRNVKPDRWDGLFSEYMRPWRDRIDGEYVLVAGQVPSDMSLRGLNAPDLYAKVRDSLASLGVPAVFRPHPKAEGVRVPGMGLCRRKSLTEALERALWVVTINSNTAVDAVLSGVPSVTLDVGAMAYMVTGHDPRTVPPTPDRTEWAHGLAYTQWSPEEIARGDAWDHLKHGMD